MDIHITQEKLFVGSSNIYMIEVLQFIEAGLWLYLMVNFQTLKEYFKSMKYGNVLFLATLFLTIVSIGMGDDISDVSYLAKIFIFIADVFSTGMMVYFGIRVYRLNKLKRC